MRICVRNGENGDVDLTFPTGLLLNRVVLQLASALLKNREIHMDAGQMVELAKALKACARTRKSWTLVEIHSARGEEIRIEI